MKSIATLFLAIASINVYATDIAVCSNPSGKGYYPEIGLTTSKQSGWADEKITGGITKLIKMNDGTYDILFSDVRKTFISSRESGAHVLIVSRGKQSVSTLVIYPGEIAEVYTFLKTSSGKSEYTHTHSRAGDTVLYPKATVMQGSCALVDFDAL